MTQLDVLFSVILGSAETTGGDCERAESQLRGLRRRTDKGRLDLSTGAPPRSRTGDVDLSVMVYLGGCPGPRGMGPWAVRRRRGGCRQNCIIREGTTAGNETLQALGQSGSQCKAHNHSCRTESKELEYVSAAFLQHLVESLQGSAGFFQHVEPAI